MRHHPSSARSRSFRYVAGFAFAAVLAVSGAAAKADEKIRILCPTWVGFAPVLVAKDLGYFKEAGIEVELRFEDDRTNVLAAMAKGEIEVDMRTVGEHQGRPRDETTPGIIIGTIDKSLGGDGVIADGSDRQASRSQGKDRRRRAEHSGPAAPAAGVEEGRADTQGPEGQGDRHRRHGRCLRRSVGRGRRVLRAVPVAGREEPSRPQASHSCLVQDLPGHHHRHHHRAPGRPQGKSREVREIPGRHLQGRRLLRQGAGEVHQAGGAALQALRGRGEGARSPARSSSPPLPMPRPISESLALPASSMGSSIPSWGSISRTAPPTRSLRLLSRSTAPSSRSSRNGQSGCQNPAFLQ